MLQVTDNHDKIAKTPLLTGRIRGLRRKIMTTQEFTRGNFWPNITADAQGQTYSDEDNRHDPAQRTVR